MRSKIGKFVRCDVLDGRFSWNFDQDKIAVEKLRKERMSPDLSCPGASPCPKL
jgi:hypothetical protein